MSFWWYKADKNCVYWLFISQLLSYPSLRISIKTKNDPTVGEVIRNSKVVTPYRALSGLRRRVAAADRGLGGEPLIQDSQS